MRIRTAYREVFHDEGLTWFAKIILGPCIFVCLILFEKETS